MKNQMIKLSVIAAVLSGMTFAANAAPTAANTVELDLSATIHKGSCDVTSSGGAVSTMNWNDLMMADFSTGAKTAIGQPKSVTLSFANCSGEDVDMVDNIKLVANQSGVAPGLSAADMWGDSDATGAGFMITGNVGANGATPITPKAPELTLLSVPADGTDPTGIATIPDVDLVVDVASVGATPTASGTVAAVVTMAAVYP